MHPTQKPSRARWGLALAATLGLASSLFAADAEAAAPDSKAQAQDRESAKAALVAAVAPLVEKNPKNIQVTRKENGTVIAKFQSGYMNTAVARVNPDGTLSISCVDSTQDLEAFLNAPETSTAAQAPKRDDR